MNNTDTEPVPVPPRKVLADLSSRILHTVHRHPQPIDFLCSLSEMLMGFFNCDGVGLWARENSHYFRCEAAHGEGGSVRFERITRMDIEIDDPRRSREDALCALVLAHRGCLSAPGFSDGRRVWTGDAATPLTITVNGSDEPVSHTFRIEGAHASHALIPLVNGNDTTIGLLHLKSTIPHFFTDGVMGDCEPVAQILGMALAHHTAQGELLERVKEMTCLYGIAQIVGEPSISLEHILEHAVTLLPPALQHPELACAGIRFDGLTYSTPGFDACRYRQSADIVVGGLHRGVVEVAYPEGDIPFFGTPFLKEEQNLLEAVAGQLALIIERRQVDEDRSHLRHQLLHADRLATIGQLAAGVAHELNEPLSSILGFAQLVAKTPELADKTRKDLDKIIHASLHAREIINKLVLFARQTPPEKRLVDLNQVIREGLYFLEARCAKSGIELICSLAPDLPMLTVNPSQITQVLTNLVVNAVQAMPEGGTLTVGTGTEEDLVTLAVEDTGTGMSEKTMQRIFVPFFTTKDVDQGTGLGLAVVHGIVTNHRGSITVESTVGRGTRFEINLPFDPQPRETGG